MCGDSNDCSETLKWDQDILPYLLTQYDPKDIFIVDETACYYKAILARTYAFVGEAVADSKTPKDWLIVMLCTNMDGSEKLWPMVDGKVKQPTTIKK